MVLGSVFADVAKVIDQHNLSAIEKFLSSMTTLEAEMTMKICHGDSPSDDYKGKIWLDRKNQLLRINYGRSVMVARDGVLRVLQENERLQEFFTEDTPAGLLLKPSIDFKSSGMKVEDLKQVDGLWVLSITYDSPAGVIPITMYFQPKPVMLLLGWTIQNPNGSITDVHLNPDKTHMAVVIPSSVFQIDSP